jgi:hypothetical protein
MSVRDRQDPSPPGLARSAATASVSSSMSASIPTAFWWSQRRFGCAESAESRPPRPVTVPSSGPSRPDRTTGCGAAPSSRSTSRVTTGRGARRHPCRGCDLDNGVTSIDRSPRIAAYSRSWIRSRRRHDVPRPAAAPRRGRAAQCASGTGSCGSAFRLMGSSDRELLRFEPLVHMNQNVGRAPHGRQAVRTPTERGPISPSRTRYSSVRRAITLLKAFATGASGVSRRSPVRRAWSRPPPTGSDRARGRGMVTRASQGTHGASATRRSC